MKVIKLGLLGFGNIGTGVYKILMENRMRIAYEEELYIVVKKILVRDVNKPRKVDVDKSLFTDKAEDILNDPEISIIAEFIGGVDPAKDYILTALRNKKTVVTANKELIARYWTELRKTAYDNNAGLYYEASVAGGIPIIKVINESLQANRVYEIMGIINGTTNYILTRMSDEGKSFKEVLEEAQKLGYAEPDPTADVEGYDAMYKLSILSAIAFHTEVPLEGIYREGITNITAEDITYGRELGYTIKLLAIAKKHGNVIETRVHPTFIPSDHPLAAVRDAYNAIFIKGDAVGNLMLYGRGAGDMPTGSAIVSDIINACHNENRHRYAIVNSESPESHYVSFNKNWETEFFVRLTVKDKPGVLAKIAGIFGKYNVSIASVIQKGRGGETAPLNFVTHPAKEMSVRMAIEEISREPVVIKVENVIRVESGQ